MVEFKVVVNDTQKGKSHNIQVTGHHANSLIGKKISDEVEGIFVSLPGYKLTITGGTDKNGFPMRSDLPGTTRKRLLLSKSLGYHPNEKGKRKKKSIRSNTINQEVVQINMKVTKQGSKSIEDILKSAEQKKEKTDEKTDEKAEAK